MFLVFHFFVVIPGHNLGNSQVSVYRTIGPALVNHIERKDAVLSPLKQHHWILSRLM